MKISSNKFWMNYIIIIFVYKTSYTIPGIRMVSTNGKHTSSETSYDLWSSWVEVVG